MLTHGETSIEAGSGLRSVILSRPDRETTKVSGDEIYFTACPEPGDLDELLKDKPQQSVGALSFEGTPGLYEVGQIAIV